MDVIYDCFADLPHSSEVLGLNPGDDLPVESLHVLCALTWIFSWLLVHKFLPKTCIGSMKTKLSPVANMSVNCRLSIVLWIVGIQSRVQCFLSPKVSRDGLQYIRDPNEDKQDRKWMDVYDLHQITFHIEGMLVLIYSTFVTVTKHIDYSSLMIVRWETPRHWIQKHRFDHQDDSHNCGAHYPFVF